MTSTASFIRRILAGPLILEGRNPDLSMNGAGSIAGLITEILPAGVVVASMAEQARQALARGQA